MPKIKGSVVRCIDVSPVTVIVIDNYLLDPIGGAPFLLSTFADEGSCSLDYLIQKTVGVPDDEGRDDLDRYIRKYDLLDIYDYLPRNEFIEHARTGKGAGGS